MCKDFQPEAERTGTGLMRTEREHDAVVCQRSYGSDWTLYISTRSHRLRRHRPPVLHFPSPVSTAVDGGAMARVSRSHWLTSAFLSSDEWSTSNFLPAAETGKVGRIVSLLFLAPRERRQVLLRLPSWENGTWDVMTFATFPLTLTSAVIYGLPLVVWRFFFSSHQSFSFSHLRRLALPFANTKINGKCCKC